MFGAARWLAGAVWDVVNLPLDLIDAAIDELREWLMGVFVDPIDELFGPEDYARAAEIIARTSPGSTAG